MTIRERVWEFIDKPFDQYNLYDVVELSKLKLKVGELAMKARSKANQLDNKYRLKRSRIYREEKLMKCTDKAATENAFVGTEKDRIEVELAKADADLQSTYHRDLNDILISIRMCARIYDEILTDKLEH